MSRTKIQKEKQISEQSQQPAHKNMVFIKGGTFTMGSPANETGRLNDEGPQHQVTLSSFYIGKYQVTQEEYQSIMKTNPSRFEGNNLPVENVSWFDTIEYCNRLSLKEGLIPTYIVNGKNVTWNENANGYRLPTEAEWEYACRAGTTTPFNTGNSITISQANFNGYIPQNINKDIDFGGTTAVGSFPPNPWGLYDMHGNVWELCWDWIGSYSSCAQTNPHGASSGPGHILRGGSWGYPERFLRSAYRHGDLPVAEIFARPHHYNHKSCAIGFRIVLPVLNEE